MYTAAEYCDMLILYGECGSNANETARRYVIRYPERRHPNHVVILNLINRTRETGNLLHAVRINGGCGNQNRVGILEEEGILNSVRENPTLGIRSLSSAHERSYTSVQRILKRNHLHAYHYLRVQNLGQRDFERRLEYCTRTMEEIENDPQYFSNILFTDECTFTRDGIFNSHNLHRYSEENPYATFPTRSSQTRFNINLWCGIVGGHLIGPFEFLGHLNGEAYASFLHDELPELMEDLPLDLRRRLIFQQDGAPAHNSRVARTVLNQMFPDSWIGTYGPFAQFPPRSPDLTPPDFFLWGFIKQIVYQTPLYSREELEGRLLEAFAQVTPESLNKIENNLMRRTLLCIQQQGGHFEQFIKYT